MNNRTVGIDDEMDLIEYWLVVKKRWKLILVLFIVSTVAGYIVSSTMTPLYRAKTSILPVSSEPSMWNILAYAGLPVSGVRETNTQKIMAVLNSVTIKRDIIQGMNLLELMPETRTVKRDPVSAAVEIVQSMVKVSSDVRTGVITISVEYKDPETARDIANRYVAELHRILREKSLTIAKMNRVFIEEQLENEENKLKMYEEQMADFQKTSKMIEPTAQLKGTMDLYANLISQKIALEIELKKIETALSENNPRITALKNQLEAVNNQINKIEEKTYKGALPSFTNAPDTLIEYYELLRKIKNSQTSYETLSSMYEKARFEEIQEGLYVEVIDPALTPDIPFKPKKRAVVGALGLASVIAGILIAFFLEWYKNRSFAGT